MLILSEKEIQSIYTMQDAIAALEVALRKEANANGDISNPHRTVLDFPEHNASILYMPSSIQSIGKAAVKVVSIFPHNPVKGIKTTQGMIVLTDTSTGEHLACLNASYLTRLRTGAVSAIATKYLAKEKASSVAIIGCGGMALEQLLAVLAVRPIQSIMLYNRTKEKAEQMAQRIIENLPEYKGKVFIESNSDEAVSKAEIVICSTRSETPVFSGLALQRGTHINGIGSYQPHMQEVDVETILKCSKIVADTIDGVKDEAGDLIIPSSLGVWNFDKLHGELSELSAGKIIGRENDKEITFFKSVGIAYFDLAVAAAVYEKALSEGVGVQIEI